MKKINQENIYGHKKRLEFIKSQVSESDEILEFGCGTGYMICFPLANDNYRIQGFDLDEKSILFGKDIFKRSGLDPNLLQRQNLKDLNLHADAIIASEVLEHIKTEDLPEIFSLFHKNIKKGGTLIVTVPNGYGWFEIESFLWFKAKLGIFIEKLKLDRIIRFVKRIFLGENYEDSTPSTLANSPHVQRFTYNSIRTLINTNGFEVKFITGTVLFAGPFSNLFFAGISPLLKLNLKLGNYFPKLASGFLISCKAK